MLQCINFNQCHFRCFFSRSSHAKKDGNAKEGVNTEHKKKDKVRHKYRKDEQTKHNGNHHHHCQSQNSVPANTDNNIPHNIEGSHNYNSYGGYDVNATPSPENSDDIAAFESIVYLQNYAKYCSSYQHSLYKLTTENRIYLEKSFELVQQIPMLRDEPDLTFKIEDLTLKWSVIYSKLRTFVNKVYSNTLYKAIQDHTYLSSNQHLSSVNYREQPSNADWSSWYSQSYSHHNNSGATNTQCIAHSRQGGQSNSTGNYNCSNDQSSAKQWQSSNNTVNMIGMEAYFPNGYHLNNQQYEPVIGMDHDVQKKNDEPRAKPKPKTQRSFSYPTTQVSQPQFMGNDSTAFHKNETKKRDKFLNGNNIENTVSSQHYKSVIEPTIQYKQPTQITPPASSLISSVQTITTISSNTSNISTKLKSREPAFSRPWEMSTQPKSSKETIFELPLNGKYSVNDLISTNSSLSHKESSKHSIIASSASAVMAPTNNVLSTQYPNTSLRQDEKLSKQDNLLEQISQQNYLESLTENLNKIDSVTNCKKMDKKSQSKNIDNTSQFDKTDNSSKSDKTDKSLQFNKVDNSSQSEYSEIESSSCAEDNTECDKTVLQEYMALIKQYMEKKKETCYTSVIRKSPLKKNAPQKKPKKPRARKSVLKGTTTSKVPSTDQNTAQKYTYETSGTLSPYSTSEKPCFQAQQQLVQTQSTSNANWNTSYNLQKVPNMVDIPRIDTTMDFFNSVNQTSASSQRLSSCSPKEISFPKTHNNTYSSSVNYQQGFLNNSPAFTDSMNSCASNIPSPFPEKIPPSSKAFASVAGKTKSGQSASSSSFTLESILSYESFASSQQKQLSAFSKNQTSQFSPCIKVTLPEQRESVLVNGITSDKHQSASRMTLHPASSLMANQNSSQGVKTTICNTLLHKPVPHSSQFNTQFTGNIQAPAGNNSFSNFYITPPEQLAGIALGLSAKCTSVLDQIPKPRRFIKALSGLQKVTQLSGLDKLGSQLVYREERLTKIITVEDEDDLIAHFFKMRSLMFNTEVSDEQVVMLSEKIDSKVEDTTTTTTTVEVLEISKQPTVSSNSSTKRLQLDEVLMIFEQEALDIQNRETTTAPSASNKSNMINIDGGGFHITPTPTTTLTQQQQHSNDGTVETHIFFGNDEKFSSESDVDLLSPGKHAINGMISIYQQELKYTANDLLLQDTTNVLPVSVNHKMDHKEIAETAELKQSSIVEGSPSNKSSLESSLEPPSFSQSIKSVKKLNSTLGKSKIVKTSSLTPFDKNHKCIPSADLKKLFPDAFLPPPQLKSIDMSYRKPAFSTTKTSKKTTTAPQNNTSNDLTSKIKKVSTGVGLVSRSKPKVVLVDQIKSSSKPLTTSTRSPSTRSLRKLPTKKKEAVRRSGRSMVNTMARIHQCNLDGSSSENENEDEDEEEEEITDDSNEEDEDEDEDVNIIGSSQDEIKESEEEQPLGSPTNRKPTSSILNVMNLSPVVNVTDAKHFVNTTKNFKQQQVSPTTFTTDVVEQEKHSSDVKSNLQDWLNKRQGKIQIINTPPLAVSPPLPTTAGTSNFNLITLSDMASKIKAMESDGSSTLPVNTNNGGVTLKKSKVVLQDCTSSDLSKALETSSRLSAIKELSNRRLNITLDNSSNTLSGKVVKASDIHTSVVGTPPAKKQKKKKYWYPKGNELESDESPVKSTLPDRSSLKRKAGGSSVTGGTNNSGKFVLI